MQADNLQKAAWTMGVCNACRYCEGHCAVFPAMTRRLQFGPADIDLLANLCHQCGACYHHCQYAEPHEFDINVPQVLEQARHLSWEAHCRPGFARLAFRRPAAFGIAAFLVFTALLIGAVAAASGPAALYTPPPTAFTASAPATLTAPDPAALAGPADFYAVIPHRAMVSLFGSLGLLVLWAWAASLGSFWRQLALPAPWRLPARTYRAAFAAALSLKNLGGGHGKGCYDSDSRPSRAKRLYHHLLMYGFLACFAATCLGTVYHYLLGLPAPYPWPAAPKVLGTLGGLAMLPGLMGLLWLRRRGDPRLTDPAAASAGYTLMGLLLLVTLTGLLLPILGGTLPGGRVLPSLLPLTLCCHLSAVAALFLNFAWGKFIHSLYRLTALIADCHEQATAPPLRGS